MSSVQSIRRAFAVLDALDEGPLGVTDVAERAALPKSTAARLLATLVGEGAVEQVPGRDVVPARAAAGDAGRRVQPGPLACRGGPAGAGRSRRRVRRGGRAGRPGWRPHPLHRPGRHAEPGSRPRLDRRARAAARRLLRAGPARVPDAGRRSSATSPSRPLERFTPRTLADPEAVRERLREVRRRGYAWAIEEFDAGISSVAAPIADASGEVIAAVHVHGPSYRFPPAGREAALAELVVTGAARIAAGFREG